MTRGWLALALSLVCASAVDAATSTRSVTVKCAGGVAERSGGYRPQDRVHRGTVRPPGWRRDYDPHWYPVPPTPCPHTFEFRLEVVPDGPVAGSRSGPDGQPLILVEPGTGYAVKLVNPLPVRAAVTLTVDGLNTLTGQPSGAADGAKWMIPAHGTVVISGWQTGQRSARRFVFTSKASSYARFRSGALEQDLTVNCGVIGAAFFWNASELEQALVHRPPPVLEEDGIALRQGPGGRAKSSMAVAPEQARDFEAGTGMGERLSNPVRSVAFHVDAGMYDPSGALAIYYDFARPGERTPQPFVGQFAPEMPRPSYWRR